MADEEPAVEPDERDDELDPVTALQNTLGAIDPSALIVGFICIGEWLEQDGSRSFSVYHTPMPPWHFTGLLKHTMDCTAPDMYPVMVDMDDDGDWEE